jgi:hypothetical protein
MKSKFGIRGGLAALGQEMNALLTFRLQIRAWLP